MDVYCKFCGEAWDPYEFHNKHTDLDTYENNAALFVKYGCGAFDYIFDGKKPAQCTKEVVDETAALRSEAAMEVSSHPDDWAALSN